MARAPVDIRSLARSHTKIAIEALSGIARKGKSESARVSAAAYLLDRGWGKAVQPHDGDGEGGPIIVEIIQRVRETK